MRRKLGAFESALTLSDAHAPLNVVAVLRLATGPDPATLERALDALARRHPRLRCRIVERGGGYAFVPAPEPFRVAVRRAERDSADAWIRETEAELAARLDAAAGAPLRCVYLGAGAGAREILLTFHHAVMDAASAISLCRELLFACGTAEAGGEPAIGPPLPPLPAAAELFPAAFRGWRRRLAVGRFVTRQLGAEIADRWRAGGAWHPPALAPTRNRILAFQLSEGETEDLVRRARRRRLTLHSVFDAALLQALARRRYPGKRLPLRHLTFANLRPYLKPPLADEHLGACFAMLRFSSTVAPERALWELAAEINAQVHAAGKRGDKYAFALTSEMMMRQLIRSGRQRMANAAISYTGAARLGEGSPYPVTALHAFVSNFRLGPEIAAQVRLWARRIWWDILYLEPELDEATGQEIGGDIRSLLVGEEM